MMAENKFYPPEAENFRARSQSPELASVPNTPEPINADSAETSKQADNVAKLNAQEQSSAGAFWQRNLLKLTKEFAFDNSPIAQEFLNLTASVRALEQTNPDLPTIEQLKNKLNTLLQQTKSELARSNQMFTDVLLAFDGSPQQMKKHYLSKHPDSNFSQYLTDTYQRTKLRRLHNVYLGLSEQLQTYESALLKVAIESANQGAAAGSIDSADFEPAAQVAVSAGEVSPSAGDNRTSESAVNQTIQETASSTPATGEISFKQESINEPPSQPPARQESDLSADNASSENKLALAESIETKIAQLQEQLATIKAPNQIGVEGVNQYFTQLELIGNEFEALEQTMDAYKTNLSVEQLFSLRSLYTPVRKLYQRLNQQAEYDFSQKRILAPQMWVDDSVYNLAEKLAEFYKKTDDEIERSNALHNAKDAAKAVVEYLQSLDKKQDLSQNQDVESLPAKNEESSQIKNKQIPPHYEARKYIDDLLTHVDNERIIPSKNAAVEAMRKAKSFPDALEWLFYNASAKGDPAHIAEALPMFQERIKAHYQQLLKKPEMGESERLAIEKAKQQAKDFMKVMWDNALNGNYANDNVSLGSGRLRLAKGATKNERALIENFVKAADKGAAERANNQLNMNEMFHTLVIEGEGDKKTMITEHFDWVTQGKRETVNSDKNHEIGPLQELISLIYQKHIVNRGSDYSFEKLFLNLQDGASQENGALMDALVDKVLGKNAEELKKFCDEEKDPHFKKIYERIYQQLQYHSKDMFAVFKAGVQYKIARDNLTELAAFQNAALNGASLPNVGGNELKKGSFGTMASVPVQLLRFRAGEIKDVPKTIPLVSSAFNIDKILDTAATTMGKDRIGDNGKADKIKKELQQFVLKYKHVNEVVMRPQMKDLLPDITSKLSYWWQGGMPPEVYALNSGKSLSAWKNAEEAMMKLQKIAAMSETRYNDGFYNSDDYRVSQRELNTIVSIIQGYTGTTGRFTDNSAEALGFWQHRNEKLAKNDGSIDYVDINVISLYLSALTYEVLGNPNDTRSTGEDNNQESYDRRIEKRRSAVIVGAGDGNALKKDLYLPIAKWFFEQHGKKKTYKTEKTEERFFGLYKKKIIVADERNDFMIANRVGDYYDSDLKLRIKDYVLKWLGDKEKSGYDYTAESKDLDVKLAKYSAFSPNVGVTERDRELHIMNHNPAVVEKITDKHTL